MKYSDDKITKPLNRWHFLVFTVLFSPFPICCTFCDISLTLFTICAELL